MRLTSLFALLLGIFFCANVQAIDISFELVSRGSVTAVMLTSREEKLQIKEVLVNDGECYLTFARRDFDINYNRDVTIAMANCQAIHIRHLTFVTDKGRFDYHF